MRKVVVTGIGVVSPNGVGKDAFWDACTAGRSGIGPISSFDSRNHPVRVAGEVAGDYDPTPFVPDVCRKNLKLMGRAARFGVGAAGLAVRDSGLTLANEDSDRVGVMMGAGVVPVDLGELAPLLAQAVQEDGFDPTKLVPEDGCPPLFPLWLLKHLPNMVAAHISLAYGCRGPNNTIVTACVAGTQAVGEGFRAVARGDADIVLAGGADSRIDPLLLLAYTALGTLSRSDRPATERSRPFDRERDGFVLGEGAAVLVLEEYERAKARGANIYAEVRGFGSSFDAYSVTKPDPTGSGGAKAIRAALKEAAVDPSDIGYINAHGTATKLNDAMETAAVKTALGPAAEAVQLSSIKSMIGHAIGAAGAIEAAALALTLKTGVVPPTINLTHPDPTCDLDYTPGSAREGRVRYGLSTSFGFGGQNGAVVMAAA